MISAPGWGSWNFFSSPPPCCCLGASPPQPERVCHVSWDATRGCRCYPFLSYNALGKQFRDGCNYFFVTSMVSHGFTDEVTENYLILSKKNHSFLALADIVPKNMRFVSFLQVLAAASPRARPATRRASSRVQSTATSTCK